MSVFAAVFLKRIDSDDAAQIAGNVGVLLQAISPDAAIPPELAHARASNLSHGTNMTWVRGGLGQDNAAHLTLKERLHLFEPRFDAVNGIDILEVAERNEVTFRIRAQIRDQHRIEPFSFETRVSLLDQAIEEGGA